jgi:hypothetical protein
MRGEHPSHPADPGDIDVTILAAEAEARGEMWSYLVTVQYLHSFACGVQVAS